MSYQRHPLSAAWPNMSPDEFASLVESIQIHGQRDPIVMLDGQVLDGWHRYQACLDARMEPVVVQFEGDDPKDFVSDKHNRRSLNLTQRMTAIALMNEWAPSGGAGKKSRVELSSTLGEKVAKNQQLTNADLAKQAGGSTKTAQQVKAAIAHGRKEVVEGMQDGTLSARRAAEIAKLPKKDQLKAITEPKQEPEDDGPDAEEIAAMEAAVAADALAMEKLFQADDKLAAAFAEIKRLNAENAQLKSRMTGLMNEKNEAISLCKSVQRKLDKLQKVAA